MRDTTNQFEHATRMTQAFMAAFVIGEIGGFGMLLAGVIVGRLVT